MPRLRRPDRRSGALPRSVVGRTRQAEAERDAARRDLGEARELLGFIALALGLGGAGALPRFLAECEAKQQAKATPLPLVTTARPLPLQALRGGDGNPR